MDVRGMRREESIFMQADNEQKRINKHRSTIDATAKQSHSLKNYVNSNMKQEHTMQSESTRPFAIASSITDFPTGPNCTLSMSV
jgi:hypothetical protein